MTTPRKIVVGVDGSNHAERALVWAADLAAAVGAELVVVHAVGLLSCIHGEPEPACAVMDELGALVAGPWTAAARAVGVEPTTLLEAGPPPMALARVAQRENADLLVVGSRGVGSGVAFGLGSTSCCLAHHADRPLAIIPAA